MVHQTKSKSFDFIKKNKVSTNFSSPTPNSFWNITTWIFIINKNSYEKNQKCMSDVLNI